ncbi:MAG TPA: orotidine-5'-phosphate decarboxylase [Ktedonobacteraceae bacterium]|nr:orotidine-5'-phosphate decarboxylase [Ktedonobacteraceae bacterium]
MKFLEKLLAAERSNQSLLCVGLDPEPERLPEDLRALPVEKGVAYFCRAIIEATAPYVSVFKPNLAFFEVLGPAGLVALQEVIRAIPAHIPVLADAKRGDIGNTARNYAAALFETYGCDAVTINPYLGYDAVAPFLAYRDRGVILLCRTSNPGARDFQDLPVQEVDGPLRPLYQVVARRVLSWNEANNCGLVVGATYPQELQVIRGLCPELPILVPGIGAQGGSIEATVPAAVDSQGERAMISISRAILYADSGARYAEAAASAARAFRDQINHALRPDE